MSTRIERVQPIRSAITVAGIVGTRPQQLPDPRLDLVHDRTRRRPLDTAAARRDANAARTVFFEHPITRAITLIGIPSARCNRRISAQSSTPYTPSSSPARCEPGSRPRGSKFGCRAGVSFHTPSTPNIIQEYWLMSSPRLRIGVRLSIGTRPRECMPGRRLPAWPPLPRIFHAVVRQLVGVLVAPAVRAPAKAGL